MARINQAAACRLYTEAHLTIVEIAALLGCTAPAVYVCLGRNSITSRTARESALLKETRDPLKTAERTAAILQATMSSDGSPDPAANDAYASPAPIRVNEQFFRSFSPRMLWVLGLLFTDGCMDKDCRKFNLVSKDVDLLENVRLALGYEGQLHATHKDKRAFRLNICRKTMCEDLLALGMTPAKSYSVQWPEMPQRLARHFVRGCWEGDGSFALNRKSMAVRASFVTVSQAFAEGLREELSRLHSFSSGKFKLGYTVIPAHRRTQNGIDSPRAAQYLLSINGFEALEEFYWYLYESVPENERLERKHDRLREFLDRKGLANPVVTPRKDPEFQERLNAFLQRDGLAARRRTQAPAFAMAA